MVNCTNSGSSSANVTGANIHNKLSSTISPANNLASTYRAKVIDAYKNRRIFTIFGKYDALRSSLLKRGWLEKLPRGRYNKLQRLTEEVLLMNCKRGNLYEAVAISKIINHFPAFFVWQTKEQPDLYMDVQPYRNRVRIANCLDFSSKVGLIGCAEHQHWFRQDGVAAMHYPRFFRLGPNQEERQAFIDEYRITQCCSLLRYLMLFKKHEEVIDHENGTICPSIVHFALGQVQRRLDDCDNYSLLDIEQSQIPVEEWRNFLENCSEVVNNRQKIKCTYRELSEFVKTSKHLLTQMEENHPDLKWDGYKNLWILKPGYMNRGRDIVIRNNLSEILQWGTTYADHYYIVQKYIEKPLLIYRTKFDIRQYMLISIRESTVQIWLYTDCYFRFSSQEYSTDDFNESIHLTNNCVQKKYKNKADRDARLPKNNMWTLNQFKAYLKSQNMPEETWEKRIFAGFKENVTAAVLPSLDETNLTKNAFELYGCDFMLDEEYNPILIEINSTPDLTPSTNVTARMCPRVLEDCLKVIVDLPRNSQASTGLFKMIYEVNYIIENNLNNMDDLSICGTSKELCKPDRLPEKPKLSEKPKVPKKPQLKSLSEKNKKTLVT